MSILQQGQWLTEQISYPQVNSDEAKEIVRVAMNEIAEIAAGIHLSAQSM
ncbi:unnamed protein product [marine sediment metagenome]|uniref:Uncharacterized protein n=1 Tax=marine sediment metagenome TaxID=412755 RepID=X0W956_9ZZZZ